MKNNSVKIFFTLFALLTAGFVSAKDERVYPAPKGILVFLGKKIPNGKNAESISVQRKDEKGDFSSVADVKCATGESEFISKSNEWKKYFPDLTFPEEKTLKTIWAKASQYGLLDSCGGWSYHPAVRIALGLVYYDLQAKENVKYQYKILVKGRTNEEATSDLVSYPFHPVFDEIFLNTYSYGKEGLYIRFRSVGNNKPAEFKVFRYDESKKPQEVKTMHSDYSVRDTNYFVVQDKTAAAGKVYQYSLVGVDRFGNTAYGSAPVIVSTQDFNALYFKKTGADKMKGRLGIKLNWLLSNTGQVGSVHIFKSADAFKNFKEIGVAAATDTSFVDELIEPDKVYHYYLEAKDKTNTLSKRSSTFFDFGLDAQAPLTPEIFKAATIKNGVKLIAFVPDRNIAGYKVYRAPYYDSSFVCIAPFVNKNADSSTVTYYDTSSSLSGKTLYNYYIVSENTSHLQSQKSNIAQAHPGVAVDLQAPATFSAYFQDGYVHLYWENLKLNDETIEGYRLYKKESSQKDFTLVFGADSVYEGSFYNDQNTEDGKTYNYEVEVIDVFGNKSKTRAIATVEIPVDKPIPPSGPKAMVVPEGIRLEWDGTNADDVTGYKLYRYQRGSNATLVASPSKTISDYTDKNVKAGELYFYYLTSVDTKKRESEPSAETGIRK